MADTKRFIRPTISVLLIGATILGVMNTFGDNTEVKAMAEERACGKPACAVTMTRLERSPFSQGFTFQVDLKTQRTVDVSCRRAYILLGAYSCTGGAAPEAAPSASAK